MGWVCSGVAFLIGAPIAGALTTIGRVQGQDINFVPVRMWSGTLLLVGGVGLSVLWTLLIKFRGEAVLF